MSSQDLMIRSRIATVRELKAQVARLKEHNSALRDEMASLQAHFAVAVAATEDLRALSDGGRMILVDGWNMILGAEKDAHSREELLEKWREHLRLHENDLVWIVFDGPRESVRNEGRLRVSYTGGTGPHRADRFICDYLRAAKFLGLEGRIEVCSNDRDLLKEAARLTAGRGA